MCNAVLRLLVPPQDNPPNARIFGASSGASQFGFEGLNLAGVVVQ